MKLNGKTVGEEEGKKTLKGRVEEGTNQSSRLQRPLAGLKPKSSSTENNTHFLNADSYKLPAAIRLDQKPAAQNLLVPSTAPALGTSILDAEISKPDAEIKARTNDSGGGNSSPFASSHQRPPTKDKVIVVRIRRLVSNLEAEIVDSALTMALNMVRKHDASVVVFLDLDSVNLADVQFEFADTLSTDEQGNLRAISLKHLRSQLTKFGAEGGRIVVSRHWATVRGFDKRNTLVPGAVLTNDEALAELLIDADNVIDY